MKLSTCQKTAIEQAKAMSFSIGDEELEGDMPDFDEAASRKEISEKSD